MLRARLSIILTSTLPRLTTPPKGVGMSGRERLSPRMRTRAWGARYDALSPHPSAVKRANEVPMADASLRHTSNEPILSPFSNLEM